MQNKYTHTQRGVSLSLSLFSLPLFEERKRAIPRALPAIVRSMRAFRVRVSGFFSSFARAIFFSFLFLLATKRKRRRCLFPIENSPLGLPPKSDRVLLYPRSSSYAGIDDHTSRRYSRRETLDARESSEIYVSFTSRGVERRRRERPHKEGERFFCSFHRGGRERESSRRRLSVHFFFHFCGSPHPPTPRIPFLGL